MAIDRVFEPVNRCLTPTVARKIVGLRAEPDVQKRLDELAAKANEGPLTPAEHAEYAAFVRAIDLVSILQSKARQYLSQSGKTSRS